MSQSVRRTTTTPRSVRARGLTKTFRRRKEVVEAVTGIDLDVADGELVAFLGPNGAGKSTTMRMLTSLLSPTAGTAEVAGVDVATHPAEVRARIGYIGQGNAGGYSYRVGDELFNQGRFYSVPREVARQRAAELLEALELTGLEARTVQSLSGGQRRRLDVAMGLMNRPGLLFLDEPTTGLDPHARANLWQHVLRLREEDAMTMLLTTHYLDEADAMAERIVLIDHGTVIADATPAQLKRDHADDVVTIGLERDADGSADVLSRARSALPADVGGVAERRGPDGSLLLVITTTHGSEVVPAALRALDRAGVGVQTTELSEASLDDVFLNLTGRSLREEAAA